MKVALYIGDHSSDGWLAQLGWWITRRVQKGPYAHVTHVEAVHAEHADGTTTIASASLRDGGVRAKRVKLNPLHWVIVDVPIWDVQRSIELLSVTESAAYDIRGAVATVFLGSPDSDKWFCNAWVSQPYLKASANFGPNHFAAIALTFGRDITSTFFAGNDDEQRHVPGLTGK